MTWGGDVSVSELGRGWGGDVSVWVSWEGMRV